MASGVAIKFDGIGANEDLIMILDLKDSVTGQEVTKAVAVDNGDIIKSSTPGGVPGPYNSEFSLDNNDGLVILESNDYNAANEHFQIQGVQIMQSANGLTGTGINLNGAVGVNGGSTGTQSFTDASFHTNDVLKITDIGFIQTTSGQLDAHLDFSFLNVDADGDQTVAQHLLVNTDHLLV